MTIYFHGKEKLPGSYEPDYYNHPKTEEDFILVVLVIFFKKNCFSCY